MMHFCIFDITCHPGFLFLLLVISEILFACDIISSLLHCWFYVLKFEYDFLMLFFCV